MDEIDYNLYFDNYSLNTLVNEAVSVEQAEGEALKTSQYGGRHSCSLYYPYICREIGRKLLGQGEATQAITWFSKAAQSFMATTNDELLEFISPDLWQLDADILKSIEKQEGAGGKIRAAAWVVRGDRASDDKTRTDCYAAAMLLDLPERLEGIQRTKAEANLRQASAAGTPAQTNG